MGLADATTAIAKDGDGGGGGGNSGSGGGDSGGRGAAAITAAEEGAATAAVGAAAAITAAEEGAMTAAVVGAVTMAGAAGTMVMAVVDAAGIEDGGGRGRRSGSDDATRNTGWGSTSHDQAKSAVSQGWALALSTVLPTVVKAVPGRVLQVDLRQSWSGEWRYEFLILTADRRYREVTVDARRNQIIQIRRR